MKYILLLLITICTSVSYASDTLKIITPKKGDLTKREVYNDAKEVIKDLASALKTTSEHVYGVLVKQAMVNSITLIICLVIGILLMSQCFKYMNKLRGEYTQWKIEQSGKNEGGYYRDQDYSPSTILIIQIVIYGVGGLSFILAVITNIELLVTGFINPEYSAIEKIIELLK